MISISHAENLLKYIFQGLCIAQRIARFWLDRALIGISNQVNPPGCASSGNFLCHCYDSPISKIIVGILHVESCIGSWLLMLPMLFLFRWRRYWSSSVSSGILWLTVFKRDYLQLVHFWCIWGRILKHFDLYDVSRLFFFFFRLDEWHRRGVNICFYVITDTVLIGAKLHGHIHSVLRRFSVVTCSDISKWYMH